MKAYIYTLLALAASVVPASAITVTTPANGAQVTSPFTLIASANTCGSQPTAAMGYSIDYGATAIVPASFSAMVIAGSGQHILHVKCWGAGGAADDADLNISVVSVTSASSSAVVTASGIQALQSWTWNNDPGTQGSSTGTSSLVSSPSLSGTARQYSTSFAPYGGEIYHSPLGADQNATHFIYDAEVWISNPAVVANIEMDLNQVIGDGDTVIFGVQCDGWSGTWDYTVNAGSPANPSDTWLHSNASCPRPSTWAPNTWHRLQLAYSRDVFGNVTYQSIVLDGVESDLHGATGNSAFTLGWGSTLITNFQLDALGAGGSTTAYIDNLTIYRW